LTKRIFLAGASGAVGKRLVPLLLAAGYHASGKASPGSMHPGRNRMAKTTCSTCAQKARAVTCTRVAALERLTLDSPLLEGIVLRYGKFYGPGTRTAEPGASAALLAIEKGRRGIFNIA
jgi:nucleoside-diphosphate-sugar epimerase